MRFRRKKKQANENKILKKSRTNAIDKDFGRIVRARAFDAQPTWRHFYITNFFFWLSFNPDLFVVFQFYICFYCTGMHSGSHGFAISMDSRSFTGIRNAFAR